MRYRFILLLFFVYAVQGFSQAELNPNGYNKIFYPNGSLQSEGFLKDGKPEGYWISYYPTGVKKSEGRRTNYQLDSILVFYNLVGDTVSKMSYLNGLKNGYTFKYYEEPEQAIGKYISKELFVNDQLEGTAYYYYESGLVKEMANYANNKREGFSYEFEKDGRIVAIYSYRKGVIKERVRLNRYNEKGNKEGLWQEFYEGFRVRNESYYKDGLLDGYYKEYTSNGELVLTLLYRDGNLIERVNEGSIESIEKQVFNEDGILKSSGPYIENKPVGIHKEFDRSGAVVKTLVYNDYSELIGSGFIDEEGQRNGSWEDYYTGGAIKAKGVYKDNQREGPWVFYSETGKVEQTGNYSKGKYSGLWKWYYPNGKIWREEEYLNGKEEGFYFEYDTLGTLIVEGTYFDGEKEGKWKLVINDHRAEGNYVTGLMDGKWRHYYDNGALSFEGNFVQGNANGKHVFFYEDGTLKEEQYYSNGIRERHWKKYNELGELKITISYKNDIEYRINGVRIDFPVEGSKMIQ